MNRKTHLLFGFAVTLAAAIFTLTLAGCGLVGTKTVTITIKNASDTAITGVYVASIGGILASSTYHAGSKNEYDKTITVAAGSQRTLDPIEIPAKNGEFIAIVTKKPDGAANPAKYLTDKDSSYYLLNGLKKFPAGYFLKNNKLPDTINLVYNGRKLESPEHPGTSVGESLLDALLDF